MHSVPPYAPKSTTKWLRLQTAGHIFTKVNKRETKASETRQTTECYDLIECKVSIK